MAHRGRRAPSRLPARCGRGGGQWCAATGRNVGGTPAVAVSSARPAIGRAACPVGTSTWCLGFVFGGKVHVRPARSIFSNALNFCCSAIAAVTVLSVALFTVSPSDWARELFPYRIVNAPALRRRARGRGGRVAEDCVMTTTSIFLDRLTAEVPTQTWKSFPKRWRAIRRLGRRRRRRSRNDQYFSLLLSQSILTLREPHIVNWGRQRCADSALVK